MPTNLYGYADNYHPEHSHVLPALIKKFHEAKTNGAKQVEIWGSGTPLREFLFVDDLADASFLVMQEYNEKQFLNIGMGTDLSIRDLAQLIQKIIGFEGNLIFNTEKPDGTPRKVMDISKIKSMGWEPKIDLETGIRLAYHDYLKNTKLQD
jgi:GDP-L-fucose synthase